MALTRSIHRMVSLAAVATLFAASCGSGSASPTLTTGSPSTGASTPTPSPSLVSSLAPSSQAPATSPGTSIPPGESGGTGAFVCAYPYVIVGTASGTVSITGVRVGAHPGYDRIVVEFAGSAIPPVRLDVVEPPFFADPSGLPLSVHGTAFVRLVMTGASGVGTEIGPLDIETGYPRLEELVRQGDFEAISTWIAGLRGPACFRVLTLSDPTRLVVDFQTP